MGAFSPLVTRREKLVEKLQKLFDMMHQCTIAALAGLADCGKKNMVLRFA